MLEDGRYKSEIFPSATLDHARSVALRCNNHHNEKVLNGVMEAVRMNQVSFPNPTGMDISVERLHSQALTTLSDIGHRYTKSAQTFIGLITRVGLESLSDEQRTDMAKEGNKALEALRETHSEEIAFMQSFSKIRFGSDKLIDLKSLLLEVSDKELPDMQKRHEHMATIPILTPDDMLPKKRTFVEYVADSGLSLETDKSIRIGLS